MFSIYTLKKYNYLDLFARFTHTHTRWISLIALFFIVKQIIYFI